MKRFSMVLIAAAAIAVPATSAVAGDNGNGNGGKSEIAKECKALKKADKAAFKATYGKNAMRSCKKGEEPAADETSPAEFKNAAKECRAEREENPEAFQEVYGSNKNKKNAFGKCVSAKVQEDEGGTPTS